MPQPWSMGVGDRLATLCATKIHLEKRLYRSVLRRGENGEIDPGVLGCHAKMFRTSASIVRTSQRNIGRRKRRPGIAGEIDLRIELHPAPQLDTATQTVPVVAQAQAVLQADQQQQNADSDRQDRAARDASRGNSIDLVI